MLVRLRRARLGRYAVTLWFVVFVSGCGFAFTHGPPSGYRTMNDFDCTASSLGPVLDIALAATFAAVAIGVIAEQGDSPDPFDDLEGPMIGVGVAGTLVFGSSGVVGLNKTSRCRDAKESREPRLVPSVGEPR